VAFHGLTGTLADGFNHHFFVGDQSITSSLVIKASMSTRLSSAMTILLCQSVVLLFMNDIK
jgi:hypothetical protein